MKQMNTKGKITSVLIKKKAVELGFNAVGISECKAIPGYNNVLNEWLTEGYNADMFYMEQNIEKRCNPLELVPNAKSIICLLTSYYPKELLPANNPQIAKYAYGHDYHEA